MAGEDYWKKRYQHSWQAASERERAVMKRIKAQTEKSAEFVGLGAGSNRFLSGSAVSRGHEKGGADLHIAGTNIYLEVTGPQKPSVLRSDSLWIRPDKIESARVHYPERETWVVHWLQRDGTLRVIRLDEEVFSLVDKGIFERVNPIIRSVRERFVEIPADHSCVRPWSTLIRRLQNP